MTSVDDDATVIATAPVTPLAENTQYSGNYRQILNASALIGGASALVVVISMVRTKSVALLLGPAGIGLMGLYSSVFDLAVSIIGVGVGSSAVRQIAEASSSGDSVRVARIVATLRRLSLLLGVLGCATLVLLSRPIAHATFGDADHGTGVIILSIAVLFRLIAVGQGALLHGMRRLHDMTRVNIVGAFLGIFSTVGLVYAFGENGIAPSIAAGAIIGLAVSWAYVRRIALPHVKLTNLELVREGGGILKLGVAFMSSGLLIMGAGYAVRALVVHLDGLYAAGIYQAAWGIGGVYVGFIMQAMGTDFYPRLVGAIKSDNESRRLVNEQTHISLLLAAPGVICTITFAPMILSAFYSEAFAPAVDILRWLCLGVAMRVITWPMGYIIIAKNHKRFFIGVELSWTLAYLVLVWVCLNRFGLPGTGIAFFGAYIFHYALVYPLARHLIDFRWSTENLRLIAIFSLSIGATFLSSQLLSPGWSLAIGTSILMLNVIVSVGRLIQIVSSYMLPRHLAKVFQWTKSFHRA